MYSNLTYFEVHISALEQFPRRGNAQTHRLKVCAQYKMGGLCTEYSLNLFDQVTIQLKHQFTCANRNIKNKE